MDLSTTLNSITLPIVSPNAPSSKSIFIPNALIPSPQQNEQGRADFAQILAQAQKSAPSVPIEAPPNLWRNLSFMATSAAPRFIWPWARSNLNQEVASSSIPSSSFSLLDEASVVQPSATSALSMKPQLALADYPHPSGDNGQGIHWVPTVRQSPEVVDHLVDEAVSMGMKWVVFLNEGTNINDNDYLVKRLTQAGIEPIMRVYTPGLTAISGDLEEMVRHYTKLGVHYFQLYNEPNLMVETGGRFPDVEQYLDLWIPAAQQVIKAGGLPGFGALSPQGEMDDREFLRQALNSLKTRGQAHLLGRSWLAMHNYTGPRPLNDPDGFMRFRQYDSIIQAALGHEMPIIGTEGGTHISEQVSEQKQIEMVIGAYKYMHQREPYNFAYTYWILANGHDAAWDAQALIRPDGPTALAQALKRMNSGGTT